MQLVNLFEQAAEAFRCDVSMSDPRLLGSHPLDLLLSELLSRLESGDLLQRLSFYWDVSHHLLLRPL